MRDESRMTNESLRQIIDAIKERIDIVKLIGSRIELNRRNMALCPFHDEKTPSFSVNPKEQYWHCFGCGAGGDAIEFLRLKEGMSFMDALRELAARAGMSLPKYNADAEYQIDSERETRDILLKTAQFYKQSLTDEARDYLMDNRGFTDNTIERFMIGYAQGGLRKHLMEDCGFTVDSCLSAGMLKKGDDGKLRDHFNKRIVFPNLLRGRVVHMTGRSLSDFGPKYLHLPGKLQYLYNENALQNEEILIAEGIPDCLTAEQAGTPSVAVLGTSQFNDSYVPRFSRCKTIYICLDADEAGQKAALKIGELMPDRVIIVSLPEGQDLSEYMKSKSPENLRELLDTGKKYLDMKIEELEALPENRRINAVEQFLPVLANVPTFDRNQYTAIIRKKFKLDKKTIDTGIDSATSNESQADDTTPVSDKPNYTEDEKKDALKLLNDPNLLERFIKTTEELGSVGEVNNKLAVFFTLTSRLLDKPLSLTIKGDSSGGKSFLVDTVAKFFPDDEVLTFTAMSAKALFHRPDNLSHKGLIICERHGAEESDYAIRSLQSEGKLVFSVPEKDPDTNQWITADHEVAGPVAYIETTTRTNLHPENQTRCFDLFIDDSPEQTARILNAQRKQYSPLRESSEPDLRHWKVAQQLLKKYQILIPYVDSIKFPTKPMRVRRDFPRFLTLIEVSTFLHQYQREMVTTEGQEYLVASVEDYAIAYGLASDILCQTIKQVSPQAEALIGTIKEMTLNEPTKPFTRRDLINRTSQEKKTVLKYLKECEQQGLVSIIGGSKGVQYKYQFIRLPDDHDNLLLHPNDLRARIENGDLSNQSKPVQNPHGEVNCLSDNTLGQPVQHIQGNEATREKSERAEL